MVGPVSTTATPPTLAGTLKGVLDLPWLRFITRRLSQALLVMLLVVLGNFIVMQFAPGDMVDVMAGSGAEISPEQMATLRAKFGIDQPPMMQLFNYVSQLATLDLGYSYRQNAPVLDIILQRLPTTGALVTLSVVFSIIIGTFLGVLSARRAGKASDVVIGAFSLVLYATPSFIVGVLMILIFSVWLRWLPVTGLVTAGSQFTGLAFLKDLALHLIMPVAALCTHYVAIYARLTRAAMLEVISQDFVRTARAKGLREGRVIYVHALRNALLPIVTMAGLQVSAVAGGAVVVETIFGLPGMARTAYDAVFDRDTSLLLGVMFVSALFVVVVNLIVDLLYVLIDPRLELK
jgi:peptide/nickel transport system permease protein